jgi:hypothetical protein
VVITVGHGHDDDHDDDHDDEHDDEHDDNRRLVRMERPTHTGIVGYAHA